MQLTLGAAAAFVSGAFIAVPNTRQKEVAALELFDRPLARLTPQEKRTAEFQAGYARWKGFFETKVYPLTRKLPGAQNPVLNPYRDQEPLGGQGEEED